MQGTDRFDVMAKQILKKYDLDNDGKLEFDEAVRLCTDILKSINIKPTTQMLVNMINKFDANNDGCIEEKELRVLLSTVLGNGKTSEF